MAHTKSQAAQPAALPARFRGPGAYELLVAARYLRRNWLSYLAVAGVALSVMTLIVVMSVMSGFDEELRSRIRGALSHLIVESAGKSAFGDYEPLLKRIEAMPEVVGCAPHLDGLALIKLGNTGDDYRWGQFSGIDLERESQATEFTAYWRDGMKEVALDDLPYGLKRIPSEEAEARAQLNVYRRKILDLAASLPKAQFDALSAEDKALLKSMAAQDNTGLDKLRAENAPAAPPPEAEAQEAAKRLSLALARWPETEKTFVRAFADRVFSLAAYLGPQGLAELKPGDRKLVEDMARERKADLLQLWRNTKPNWGPADMLAKEGEAPCIVGRDVVVLGRDENGAEVSYGLGRPIVLIVASGWDDRAPKSCRIAGKFKSGMYEYDSRQVYLPLDVAQRLLRKSGQISSINIKLKDYGQAELVRAKLMGLLTPRELAAWRHLLNGAIKALAGQPLRQGEDKPPLTVAQAAREVDADLAALNARAGEWLATGNPQAVQRMSDAAERLASISAKVRAAPNAAGLVSLGGLAEMEQAWKTRQSQGLGCQEGASPDRFRFRVWTWEDKRRNTLRAVWLERRMLALILSLLVLVSGFVILSILHTSVITKTRDIGILKATGATMRGILTLFLTCGLLIGVVGSVLGVIAGVWLSAELNTIEDLLYNWFSFRVFPRDVYSLDRIPTDKDPFWSIVIIATSAVAVAFVSALYPAWRAARMDPVEAIRYE